MNATKLFQLFAILFLVPIALNAQDLKLTKVNSNSPELISHKFGKVSEADFAVRNIEGETEEVEAVVIYDIGLSFFEESDDDHGFNLVFERKTRIKINSKAGFKYGTVEIPLYGTRIDYEKVKGIKAFTWNMEDGELVKVALNKKDIFTETTTPKWTKTKFALPNVKEGSVIEYTYRVISPFKFNLTDWKFQRRIPTLYSEYTVRMIPFFEYACLTKLNRKLDILENHIDKNKLPKSYGNVAYYDNVFKYGVKNIEAFKGERFIGSPNDYIAQLDFQLSKINHPDGRKEKIITTWKEMESRLLKHTGFGVYLKNCKKIAKKIVDKADIMDKSKEELFNFAVDYVKQNFRWNERYGTHSNCTAKDFVKEKEGNVAAINLFLVTLLDVLEMEAYPVILSTRKHGKIFEDYPILDLFNYVVVSVKFGDQWFVTDGTEPLCVNYTIPPKCFNGKGLIIAAKEKMQWILLEEKMASLTYYKAKMHLSEEKDSIIVDFEVAATGYDALDLKSSFKDDKTKLTEHFEEQGLTVLTPMRTQNYLAPAKKYKLGAKMSRRVNRLGEEIFFYPFVADVLTVNPLKQKERRYPVDITYTHSQHFQTQIYVPKGYTISSLPENFVVDDDLMTIQYNTAVKDQRILVIGNYEFKKAIYLPDEYTQLKQHFEDLVKYFNQQVGLEKVE